MLLSSHIIFLLIVLSLSLLIRAEVFPIYVVSVYNLHVFSDDTRNCTHQLNRVHSIVLEAHRFAVDYVNERVLNGTGLALRTFMIDACYNAGFSIQQVDCIFLRAEPFGIIPKGLCQLRSMEKYRTACNGFNITEGQLVAVMGPISSDTAEQYALFMQKYCIPVLSSAATSRQFDDIGDLKYFLRSVPSDKYQVQAIIRLLEEMKLHRVTVVHDKSNYAKNFHDEFVRQVENLPKNEKKICIEANVEVLPHIPGVWNDTVKKLEDVDARVILIFMDFKKTRHFFDAVAKQQWVIGRHQFIGIDAWSNHQDFTDESKKYVVGSITTLQSSPVWELFRKHIMNVTLEGALQAPKPDFCSENNANNSIPYFIQSQNQCITNCTGGEKLIVSEGTLIRASQEFINVYVVAKALENFCRSSRNCKMKLGELTGPFFYDLMKSIEINLPDYYFKFVNNSGMPQYNFYQFTNPTDNQYIWNNVGYFNISADPNAAVKHRQEFKLNLIISPHHTTFCPENGVSSAIIFACTMVSMLLIIIVILIAVIIRKHHQARKQKKELSDLQKKIVMQSAIRTFHSDALKRTELLDEGYFGEVWKASIYGTEIVVKVLRGQQMNELRNFFDEFNIMMQVGSHPNIVQLLGVVTETTPTINLMICMEYCEEGSLLRLIERERDKYWNERVDVDEYECQAFTAALTDKRHQGKKKVGHNLATRDLLSYGYQIANGMCYLEEKGVVHRDLAPRNVLVRNGIAKISDYGLSVICGYFRESIDVALPVSTLAPECLVDPTNMDSYTSQSDVWAFGLLLWNIFNLCRLDPYKIWNVTGPENLLQMLRDGKRPNQPIFATETLHKYIVKCWEFQGKERPGFKDCKQQMVSELRRCAPGAIEKLHEKLDDEISTVKKDSLREQLSNEFAIFCLACRVQRSQLYYTELQSN